MYFYEHSNGNTISQPDIVVDTGGGPDAYFDSPYVKRWWHEPDGEKTERETQASIEAWRVQMFGSCTFQHLITKARAEFDELERAVAEGRSGGGITREAADVLIMLYGIAEKDGVDLETARDIKMAINRARNWNPVGDGTFQHAPD